MTSWAGCPDNFQGQSFPFQFISPPSWFCYASPVSLDSSETYPNDGPKCPSTVVTDEP